MQSEDAKEGQARACEGILRTQFGRKKSGAAGRAIKQLRARHGVGNFLLRFPFSEIMGATKPSTRMAMAAAVMLCAALAAFLLLQTEPVRMEISEASGSVVIERQAERIPARVGFALQAKDVVRSSAASSFKLRHQNYDVEFTVDANSALNVIGTRKGVRVDLFSGKVEAQVGRQPASRPVVVATAQGEVKVLGTHFLVTATEDLTRVEVAEGKVRFSRKLGARSSIEVRADQYAVAGHGIELAAKTLLPAPWVSQDIGKPGVAGSASYGGAPGKFTVRGAGEDIWNEADSFHFVFQPLEGDGEIEALVQSVQETEERAKACLAVRESLDPGAKYVAVSLTPGNNTWFQFREEKNAFSHGTDKKLPKVEAPYWLKLIKHGDRVTGYRSANGSEWERIGEISLRFGPKSFVGFGVTSHNDTVLNNSLFEQVRFTPPGGQKTSIPKR